MASSIWSAQRSKSPRPHFSRSSLGSKCSGGPRRRDPSCEKRRRATYAQQFWLVMEGDGPPALFRARLAGAGRHLPATVLTTEDLMATTRHRTRIDLERLTGIKKVAYRSGRRTPTLSPTSAAIDCLGRARQQAAAARRRDQLQHLEVSWRPDPVA